MRIVKPYRCTNIYLKPLSPVQPRVIRHLQMVLKRYLLHTLIADVKLQLISISVFRKRKKKILSSFASLTSGSCTQNNKEWFNPLCIFKHIQSFINARAYKFISNFWIWSCIRNLIPGGMLTSLTALHSYFKKHHDISLSYNTKETLYIYIAVRK